MSDNCQLAVHEEQIFKCLLRNIEHYATITEIKLSRKYSEFGGYSLLSFFLISYSNLLSQNDSSKLHSVFKISMFGPTTKVSPSFIAKAFRSLIQSPQTRVLHVVDLFVFCGILASFLA